jgi:hypothetical protein
MSAVGNGLVVAGAAVGVATVAAVASGYEIVLTPAMVHLLVYKAIAAAAVGLIVVGSWLGRRGRQQESQTKAADNDSALLTPGLPPLPHERGTERLYEEATTKSTKSTKKNLT